ncbi:MAG: hypothetical protein ACI955_001076 [Zhongshania sp.]
MSSTIIHERNAAEFEFDWTTLANVDNSALTAYVTQELIPSGFHAFVLTWL